MVGGGDAGGGNAGGGDVGGGDVGGGDVGGSIGGVEGKGGGEGGGIGGKMGCCTSTDRVELTRPSSAATVRTTWSTARLPPSSVFASAAPPGCTTIKRAETASSDEELAVTLAGSGSAVVVDMFPVTGRFTSTSTSLLSFRALRCSLPLPPLATSTRREAELVRLTVHPGEAATHTLSTSATSVVAFAEAEESLSDQVCATSTSMLSPPTSSAAKLA